MKRTLIIRPEAEADLAEAYAWYEDRIQGMGSYFLLNIDAAFSSIQKSPEMYPNIYKNVRRCLVRRFPYGVFYMIEDDRVIVVAIFHAKRNPRRWKDRV